MPAIGFFSSAEAMRALDRHHKWLQDKCLAEQREAAGSSERRAIGEAFEPELDAVARCLDFLRRVPDGKPRPYTPRELLDEHEHALRLADEFADAEEKAQLDKLDAIKNGDFD